MSFRWNRVLFLSKPFISCRIGSPGIKSGMDVMFEAQTSVNQSILKNSPLKFLFPKSSSESHPGVSMIPGGTQEDVWGSPIPLQGQLGSCCIFHEGLQPAQAKALYAQGLMCFCILQWTFMVDNLTNDNKCMTCRRQWRIMLFVQV